MHTKHGSIFDPCKKPLQIEITAGRGDSQQLGRQDDLHADISLHLFTGVLRAEQENYTRVNDKELPSLRLTRLLLLPNVDPIKRDKPLDGTGPS